jgi:hypothetical protein
MGGSEIDVQMPDGTLVKGVPEGTTKAQLLEKLQANGHVAAPEPVPAQAADLADKIAGSSTGRFVLGVADPILNVTARAASALGDPSGLETMAHLKEMKERGQAALGNEGFDWLGLAGNIASPLATKVASAVPAVMAAKGVVPALEGVAKGAGAGAVLGGTTAPSGTDNSDWLAEMGKGGVLGGLISSGYEGVKAAWPVLRSVFGSTEGKAGRLLADVTGDKSSEVVNALLNTRSRVPGETLTAGQAAVPAASPTFAALQEIVSAANPKKYGFGGIEGANEEARQALIGTKAGTPDLMAQAVLARRNAAEPYYEALQTSTATVKASPVLSLVRDIMEKNKNEDSIVKPLTKIESKLVVPTEKGSKIESNVSALVSLSRDIKAQIEAKNPDGTPSFDIATLTKVKNLLDEQIDKAEPAYAQGRKVFKEMSVPVNTMQTGQRLERSLTEPLGVNERPSAFARAATDQRTPMLNAQTQAVTDAIMESLSRDAIQAKLAREGASATTKLIGADTAKFPSVGMFSPKVSVLRAILNQFSDKGTGRVMDYLSENMDNPQKIAQILKVAGAPPGAIIQALVAARNPAIAAATYTGGH